MALFIELVDELDTRDRLMVTLTEGCGSTLMTHMLRRARRWVHKNRGLKMRIERPYVGAKCRAARQLAGLLAAHLSQPGRAAILGTPSHWTVAREIADDKILLFDSNDRTFMWVHGARVSDLVDRLHLPGTFLISSK
jgi:hypothetical protein